MIRYCTSKLKEWLQNRYLSWHLTVLAMLLCAPSLWLGLQWDDHLHRAALTLPDSDVYSSPHDLFSFLKGDEQTTLRRIALGHLPWWSPKGLRLADPTPENGSRP